MPDGVFLYGAKMGNGPESNKLLSVLRVGGLTTVVRASVNRDALAKALRLRPDQKITLAQTVGYPKASK